MIKWLFGNYKARLEEQNRWSRRV